MSNNQDREIDSGKWDPQWVKESERRNLRTIAHALLEDKKEEKQKRQSSERVEADNLMDKHRGRYLAGRVPQDDLRLAAQLQWGQ